MSHRIEIELTSRTEDGSWTWRAAGARQPRGTVSAALVPEGTLVGAVLRAEVDISLDGTTVTGLVPARTKADQRSADRIEVVGTPHRGSDVNVRLAPGKKPRREDRGGRGGRGRPAGPGDGDRAGSPRDARLSREARRPDSSGASDRQRRPASRPARERDRQRRPGTSTAYRNEALAGLRPEELPVAEQLLRGGIPAVRQAIDEQNARARADHRPEVTPAPLLSMAERLLPIVNLAAWKDRAVAARNAGKEVPLREVRSIVAAASTVSLDKEATELTAALRTSLDERVTALRERWVSRISSALDEGRVSEALRTSLKPPEPAARLSAELALELSVAAGRAMTAETPPEEWLALLELVVESPVRRTVKPLGLPSTPDEALLTAARRASGSVPELARLLGIPVPPPPRPRRAVTARSPAGRRVR